MVRRTVAMPEAMMGAAAYALVFLSACAPAPELRPHLTDAQYDTAMERHFQPGMSAAEVERGIDGLGLSGERRWYTGVDYAGVGPQLLVRVYERGGQWIDRDDQTIEWVDTWFVFSPSTCMDAKAGSLRRWYTQRGGQRYFEGEPINAPPEDQTMGPTRRYPFPPPLPARPPQGITN